MQSRFRTAEMLPALLAAVLALVLLAPPAVASEARTVGVLVERCGGEGECYAPRETMLVYEDRSRTANRLTVRRGPRAIELADPAATIRPGRGCRRSSPHVVRCRVPE
jgi:hypothetical protein